MSAIAFEVKEYGLEDALLRINRIAEAPMGELAEGIGRLVQEQTRRRITDEKTAPDGTAWKRNALGSPILYASGALTRSIDYVASATSIMIGSALVYARIHQQGGKIVAKSAKALAFKIGNLFRMVQSVTMPRRQYLGLSSDNQKEIVETAEDWLGRLLQ